MSKLFTIAFCVLLSFSISLGRKSINESCDAFNWCEKGLKCVNYVCVVGTQDNVNEKVEWAPKGPKCSIPLAKYCPRNYFCREHRCYSAYLDHPMYDPQRPESELLKQIVQKVEQQAQAQKQSNLKQQQTIQQQVKQQQTTQQVKQQQPVTQQQTTQQQKTVQQVLSA